MSSDTIQRKDILDQAGLPSQSRTPDQTIPRPLLLDRIVKKLRQWVRQNLSASSSSSRPGGPAILVELGTLCKKYNRVGKIIEDIEIPDVLHHLRQRWEDSPEERHILREVYTSPLGFPPLLNRHAKTFLFKISPPSLPKSVPNPGATISSMPPPPAPTQGQSVFAAQKRLRQRTRTLLETDPGIRSVVQDSKTVKTSQGTGTATTTRKRRLSTKQTLQRILKRVKPDPQSLAFQQTQRLRQRAAQDLRQLRQVAERKKKAREQSRLLAEASPIPFSFYLEPDSIDAFIRDYQDPFPFRYQIHPGFYFTLSRERENAVENRARILSGQPVQKPRKTPYTLTYEDFRQLPRDRYAFFPVHLRPYQNILAHDHARSRVFYHEAGTGKTLTATATAVDFLLSHLLQGHDAHVIIGAPLSTIDQVWKNEIVERINPNLDFIGGAYLEPEIDFVEAWLGHRPSEVREVYDTLQRVAADVRGRILIRSHSDLCNPKKLQALLKTCDTGPVLFILDEAHNFNISPPVSRKIIRGSNPKECTLDVHNSFFLYQLMGHRNILQSIFLTATPIVNRLADVNNLVRWIQMCHYPRIRDTIRTAIDRVNSHYLLKTRYPFPMKKNTDPDLDKVNEVFPLLAKNVCDPIPLRNEFRSYFSTVRRDAANYPDARFVVLECKARFPTDPALDQSARAFEEEYRARVRDKKLRTVFGSHKSSDDDEDDDPTKTPSVVSAVYKNEIEASIFLWKKIKTRTPSMNHQVDTNVTLPSPIVLEILSNNHIRLTDKHRTVIYVQNEDSLLLLKHLLLEKYPRLSVQVINGTTEPAERQLRANQFSTLEPELGHVLLIMRAATEGVNLKKVTNVVFANEVWTQSMYDQIVGRGVRFRSHITLPAKDRVVHVFNLYNHLLDDQGHKIDTIGPYMRSVREAKKQLCSCFEQAVANHP